MWAGNGSRGRGRSARRIQLYKKRLVYAAHRGCGSALVVQVAYLIFIRSLFEYSVSFPPLSSLLSISFSIFAYFASLLLLALLFRQLLFDKAAKLLNTYLLLLPTKTAKKKELCQQVALIARVSLLPAGCLHHSPTPTCPVPPYPALLCRYTWRMCDALRTARITLQAVVAIVALQLRSQLAERALWAQLGCI